LAVELESVVNLRMAVREYKEDVVFTHRVEQGAADRSYGIQVARLAGIPQPLVQRAKEILENLERDEYGRDGLPRRARRRSESPRRQPTLFDVAQPAPEEADVLEAIRRQPVDELSPLDALNLLAEWSRKLKG
jgi:DNA mismatch repair protein MutS